VLQSNPHTLVLHFGCALGGAVEHTSPQLPQLLRSFVVFAHSVGLTVGQAVNPALQLRVQPPVTHAG
jgi:hypothetical protein